MGRPTKFNRVDAIETAMNIFWAQGFEPTSVSDLASAMSITRSSFYNSFQSRERIFDEALDRYQSDGIDLKTEMTGDHCPVSDLREFFRCICQKLAADPAARGCMIINCHVQASEDNPPPKGVQAFVDTKRQQFNQIAKAGQQAGFVPAHLDPVLVGGALLALLIGVNVMGRDVRDADALWSIAETVLDSLGFTES